MRGVKVVVVALVPALGACGAGSLDRLVDEPAVPQTPAPPAAPAPAKQPDPVEVTRSPWPLSGTDAEPRARAVAKSCGESDGAVERVAREVARTRARGLGAPDGDKVAAMLRAAGVPHPRPRVLSATGSSPLDDDDLRTRVATLATPLARCGVAVARTPHGGEVWVAIAVDALADLAPLPRRARAGEWLTVEAKLHVGAKSARVLLTGLRGPPRSVPASLDAQSGVLRARFALDRPGAYLVQVVGDVEGGPRPLLEARVGSEDVTLAEDDGAAPGEEASGRDDPTTVERMVLALRTTEDLRPLARDRRLDALARAHALQMAKAGLVAHDVGSGDLRARAGGADIVAKRVGENVAHAADLARAHRALHASPSHRLNLLDADYTRIGIGVVRAEDGSVWVCQIFGTD